MDDIREARRISATGHSGQKTIREEIELLSGHCSRHVLRPDAGKQNQAETAAVS